MSSTRATLVAVGFSLLLAARSAAAADCSHLPAPDRPSARTNDNRIAAGATRDGIVTIRLVIREASWSPDGAHGCALRVRAFAEEGKTAQIPGPLIRVKSGTEVRVLVRNALAGALWVRGLQARDVTVLDSTELASGATHEFRFRAGAPGAWYYWAGDANAVVPISNANGQLVGALVVDPITDAADMTQRHFAGDRVFVMTRWTPTGSAGNRGYQLNAINGRSWPNTERLTYTVGDSIRWHVINASDELHMMHLHGFYFRVDARGDAAHDSTLVRARPIVAVSNATRRGEWLSMAWSPDRAGNWLFHCHLIAHMSADQRLDRMPGAKGVAASTTHEHGTAANHATESMAGLILGITILPSRSIRAVHPPSKAPARAILLFANMRPRVFGDDPGFGFIVQEGPRAPARDSVRIPGTPLLLTRGEPVSITVHNRLDTPLGVHWHGIELESYADGVGGWSGARGHIAPIIAVGDSFIARFTPPRAGTFMYHVHSEHGDQLASGLYAPLLVLEPGQKFDPQTDKVFVIASGGPAAGRGVDLPAFVNGTMSPDTLTLTLGTTYRFRLIDISANEARAVILRGPAGPLAWRVIARDGRNVPSDQAIIQQSRENTSAGVTRDYEFTPTTAGDFGLTVTTIVLSKPTNLVTTVPIHVHAP